MPNEIIGISFGFATSATIRSASTLRIGPISAIDPSSSINSLAVSTGRSPGRMSNVSLKTASTGFPHTPPASFTCLTAKVMASWTGPLRPSGVCSKRWSITRTSIAPIVNVSSGRLSAQADEAAATNTKPIAAKMSRLDRLAMARLDTRSSKGPERLVSTTNAFIPIDCHFSVKTDSGQLERCRYRNVWSCHASRSAAGKLLTQLGE